MLRRIVDQVYRSLRNTDTAIDPNVPIRTIVQFVSSKLVARGRSLLSGRHDGFVSSHVRFRGKRFLSTGANVSFGYGVLIDATSISGITLGDRVTIDDFAILRASGVLRNLGVGITVGANTSIGAFNFIHGGGGVMIGENCLLGPNVSIFSENHVFADLRRPIREQGETRMPVTIADDVWVGSGSTILSGVSVGAGAVIAAGSVVTKDVPPRTIVGGTPAKPLRSR